MSVDRRGYVWILLFVLIGAGVLWWLSTPPPLESKKPPTVQPLPIPKSRFLNTSQSVAYIGSAACIKCHDGEHQSYLHTAHSRALSLLAAKSEPGDAAFFHKPSGRHYKVYRDGGVIRHRESLRIDGDEVVATDHPIHYLIGSGRYTRSYLVKSDDFLLESPITWYTSRQLWDMSPGYDRPNHWGFERTVGTRCLACHSGKVESQPNSRFQVRIIEQSISCEQCHGPGSLHATRHQSAEKWEGLVDLTIVRPSRLPRARLESICGQCHLQADAAVPVRGRRPEEFRPGLLLSDFRVDYGLKKPESQMTVVGHIEQLRLSACYKKSPKLTCLTCHDLHARNPIGDKVAYYRNKCISCHEPAKCKMPVAERIKKSKQDNCITCHMPTGDTDIPHVAFTHHRIGIHRDGKAIKTTATPELVALEDISRFPAADQDRCMGLGYLNLAGKADSLGLQRIYLQRTKNYLERAYEAGLRDCETLSGLAAVYNASDPMRSIKLAKLALESEKGTTDARDNAMYLLALTSQQPSESLVYVKKLTKLRRRFEDWLLLGICHDRLHNPVAAMKAFVRAAEINPFRPEVYQVQAKIHDQLGEKDEAVRKRALAKRIAGEK